MKIYRGIGPEEDTVVTEDKAYDYALERCLKGTEEDRQESEKSWSNGFFQVTGLRRKEKGNATCRL